MKKGESLAAFVLGLALLASAMVPAFGQGFAEPGGYGLKIYRVNSALYPFVQVYVRTFDQNQLPMVNVNERNVGLMVKGRAYDPMKGQYRLQNLRQRQESIRTVLVLDASKSMAGAPFDAALKAAARYVDSKRPQDEVAVLAIRDTKEGYEVVSSFERQGDALGRRLADVKADGMKTRLYDTIGAAMQMCAMSSQGSVTPSAENMTASCSIVVFSDGQDDGSALSREELNTRIAGLPLPLPIYSLAYSRLSRAHFKNLESISKNSFGKYYLVGEAFDQMQRVVEEIQNILQSDYVLTFRSVIPVDGEMHTLRLGIEYPTGSSKFIYDSGRFEALEPPPVGALQAMIGRLNQMIPPAPDNDPYAHAQGTAAPAQGTAAPAQGQQVLPQSMEAPAQGQQVLPQTMETRAQEPQNQDKEQKKWWEVW